MDRKQKIQLLQRIDAGDVSINSLKDKKLMIDIGMNETKLFINNEMVHSDQFFSELDIQTKGKQVSFNVQLI